jgi:peptidylprolyl isomerase
MSFHEMQAKSVCRAAKLLMLPRHLFGCGNPIIAHQSRTKGDAMEKAGMGTRAKIHYTVKLQNGKAVGSSKGGQPLSFTIGRGKVFKKLEQGIIGMKVGDVRTIDIAAEDAYGVRDESRVMRIDRSKIDSNIELQIGRIFQYRSETQETVNLLIRDLDDDTVTVDANHPLAGEALTYTVHLVAVE